MKGAPPLLRLRVPGDKSLTHRALLLAAMADGESRIRGALDSADTRATAAALHALGVELSARVDDEVRVHGRGAGELRAPAHVVDCANSGTTARLLCGLLSSRPFTATLDGDASLRARPMRRVTAPLEQMGARFEELGAADRLPLSVVGERLRPIEYENVPASAQVKSALLLAGLGAGVPVVVLEPQPTRDHTERLLRAMGANIHVERQGAGQLVRLGETAPLAPLDFDVPGDFSSAAFLLAFALLHPSGAAVVAKVGVNPGRIGLIAVMERMGAQLRLEARAETGGEPVADVAAGASTLRGAIVSPEEIPAMVDEVPVLAALAARAEGDTVVRGAAELRVKESDRLAALARNLRAIGVAAEELPDGLAVHGTGAALTGAVETQGDHRIAMAFGVLAALPGNRIEIDDAACVAVSYPGFWSALAAARQAFEA